MCIRDSACQRCEGQQCGGDNAERRLHRGDEERRRGCRDAGPVSYTHLDVYKRQLLDNLAQLGQPVLPSVATRLWGCVVIDGRACSSCRMCATFCPTGAIRKFDNDDGTLGVYHYPGECVKCGSCRDVCPENAIELLDEVRPAYLLEGAVHRYAMAPRPVELGTAQQMVDTMRCV